MWEYYRIHPDVYLSLAEKHLSNLLEDEEIDVRFGFESVEDLSGPLIVFLFTFTATAYAKTNYEKRFLGDFRLEVPNVFDNKFQDDRLARWLSNPKNLL